jgi:hypothetical protein
VVKQLGALLRALPASCPVRGFVEDVVLPCQGLATANWTGRTDGGGAGAKEACCTAARERGPKYAALTHFAMRERPTPLRRRLWMLLLVALARMDSPDIRSAFASGI